MTSKHSARIECCDGVAFHPSRDGLEFKLQLAFVKNTLKRELLTILLTVTLGVLLLTMTGLHAQTPGEAGSPRGFLRMLNAVGSGTGKLEFRLDGAKVRAEGYEFGDVTGGIPRKPGTYKISFRREGVESAESSIEVVKNQTATLIPFVEQIPATKEKPAYWKIRVLKLKQQESEDKRTATIVNVTREAELKVEIRRKDDSWETLMVKRLDLARTAIQQGSGYVPLRTGGKDLKPLSVGSSGNFVAVLYEDAEGVICSRNFQDYKYLSAE